MKSTDSTISGSEIAVKMKALSDARKRKYAHLVVSEFPSLYTVPEPVIFGDFSWTLLKSKQRWIIKRVVLDIGNGPQTPTEIARDYVDAAFPRKLRAYADQIPLIKMHRSAVLYAVPGRVLKGVYLDVKSAYWSIVKIVGYNVDYFPGKWVGQGRDMSDFPLPEHKLARSSLVSMGLMHPLKMWDGEGLIPMKKVNPRVNFGLWALVQDVLHGIAADLKQFCSLKYAHTDGFIVPYHEMETAVAIVSEKWGLPVRIKVQDNQEAIGLTQVYGVGRYEVGPVRTKTVGYTKPEPFNNITSYVDREWPQPAE